MSRPRLRGASFDPDDAEILPSPPTLFKQLRVACPECPNTLLTGETLRYAFFPTTVYIEGECPRCAQTRSALFAPEPGSYIAQAGDPVTLSTRAEAELADFLAFLSQSDSGIASPDSAGEIVSGTDIDIHSGNTNRPRDEDEAQVA